MSRPVGPVDLQLDLGQVPEIPGPPSMVKIREIDSEGFQIDLNGVASYRFERSGTVIISVLPGAQMRVVRAFLLGIAMATFMHRRGVVPLHVSAIRTPSGLVAFTGESGAGKSTTAAVLHKRTGWPIFCDDVAAVSVADGKVAMHCGLNRLKLWDQKIRMLGLEHYEKKPDLLREEKFHLLAPELFDGSSGRCTKLVLLSNNGERRRLAGAEKFFGVLESVYRPEVAQVVGDPRRISEICARVADAIDVYHIDGSGVLNNDPDAIDAFIEGFSDAVLPAP